MKKIFSSMEVINNKETFDLRTLTRPSKLYVTDKLNLNREDFWHNQLPDGVVINNNIYIMYLENEIFKNYFNNLDNNNFSKVCFVSDFLNINELNCKGKIVILGRYFLPKSSKVPWGSLPRGVISKTIHETKDSEKSNNFMIWDNNLVTSLKFVLQTFIDKSLIDKYNFETKIMKNDYGPRVIVTALPNRNRLNRFSSFLESLSSLYSQSNLIFTDKLFVQTKDVRDITRNKGYQAKKEILSGLYEINKNYKTFFNNNTKIIIIDDVLTTGLHFELALEALKNEIGDYKYEVSGIFLTATQSNVDYRNKGYLKLKNPRFVI